MWTGPLPKTTPEQRAPLYEDVEGLIEFGFLSHSLTINGTPLSLRSLNPGDQFVLRHRVHGATNEQWQATVIASSVWMIDGQNLLGEVNVVPWLVYRIRCLPPNVREILINIVLALFDRVGKASEAVESYAYERISRYRWRATGGQAFGEWMGVNGKLGTNHVQRMWTFFNTLEDQRLADDNLWEGFKLVTSAQAPKGIKKLDAKDKQQHQLELDRRQGIQDRFYYIAKGVIKPPKDVSKGAPTLSTGSKSADELSGEMRRWVAGEEDWHDKVVNDYKRRISENYERHKQQMAARAAALAAMREEESGEPQPLVAYTPEQLAEILKDRQPGPAGVRQVGAGMNAAREYLYTKYLERPPDAGNLEVGQDGRLTIKDASSGLGQRVSDRQITFRPGPDDEETRPPEW